MVESSPPSSIHPMSLLDVPAVVRLHERELTGDFMSRFGGRFLAQLYSGFLESPYAEALVAVDGRTGEVTGALLGVLDTQAHNTFLLRSRGPALAFYGFGQALLHPTLARDVLCTRSRRYLRGVARAMFATKRGRKPEPADPEQVGIISYVMVDRVRRGSGIGASLVAAYEGRAESAGLDRLELVTHPDGGGAGPFYCRIGWQYAGERMSDSGERFALYTRRLGERPSAGC